MSSTRTVSAETHFVGLPINGGIAVARVCLFNEHQHSNLPIYKVSGEGLEYEKNRVRQAIRVATTQLEGIIRNVADRIGPAEAQIFAAQKAILGDSLLVEQIFENIETRRLNAEAAVSQVLDEYEYRLAEVDSEYIRERATDIGEIRRRLLDVFSHMDPSRQCGDEAHCQKGRNRIVVAEELTPGLTVELDAEQTMGVVTERGGPTSHAAILARALGIPAVSNVKGICRRLGCGTELLLNGHTGEVTAWPSEDAIARARESQSAVRELAVVDPIGEVTVMANISHTGEMADAVRHRAEGIGLYRTEFEFLAAGRILDEEEQLERYVAALKAMSGHRVCFRLLDVGADKGATFFNLPQDDNPYLGFRGSRLLLNRTDLLRHQARALARASIHGPVDVLYPMVVSVEQFLKLRELFSSSVADITPGELRHGVMFEVPAACLQARELLEVADFGSIGTNDLIQYLFAVDRNNALVAHDYTPDSPVLWSVVAQVATAAAETGRAVSVCGEAANNPRFLPTLRKLGLTTLSVSPRFIPELRLAAREGKAP